VCSRKGPVKRTPQLLGQAEVATNKINMGICSRDISIFANCERSGGCNMTNTIQQ
jgi:hypothetical protein